MAKQKGEQRAFNPFREMRDYSIIWSGQLASLIGSGMTIFALMVWLFETTGQATSVSLLFLFSFGPSVALSPLAGVIVDRYSRKTIMLVSDGLAAISAIGLLGLHQADMLSPWAIYGLMSIGGVFQAFQFPALSAATTLMVPKEHYGRASGMLSTAWALSGMAAPIMAALMLGPFGLTGVLLVDLVTFVAAVVTLAIVPIPKPKATKEGEEAKASWKEDLTFGWKFIWRRPSLLRLLMFYFVLNLTGTIGWVLVQPMILAKTANNEVILGTVMALGGIGGIIGGVVMSIWGGPKRRIRGILLGMFIGSGLGTIVLGLNGGLLIWAMGMFFWTITDPLIMGSSQAIWQSKVPPDVQGRVFSVRFFIALVGALPAMVIAGPLADLVFEPLMMDATGPLAWLVGTGPGAGMGLLIVISGVIGVIATVLAYSSRPLRNIEDILPDFEEEDEEKVDGEKEKVDGEKEKVDGEKEKVDEEREKVDGEKEKVNGEKGDDGDVEDDGGKPSEEAPEEGAGEADEAGGPAEQGPNEP